MTEMINLINKMSPYLLLGFLLAGLMYAFIPSRYYTRFLSHRKLSSVVNAAILGIPLPLCSCGVIPTAMSLRKEGVSRGATTAFLIATPQTGIDSIIATYALMGLPFAIVRPLAALATSLLGGTLANAADRGEDGSNNSAGNKGRTAVTAKMSLTGKLVVALRYAYVDMMQDIGKWLVVGLVIAGLITVLLPESAFTIFRHNTAASMLLVLIIAMPMYVCATGSIPIAVALMMKGLTPGAALVLLMAGPACNFASMLVVRNVMGTRSLLIYLLSIVLGAIAFGCAIDWLQFHGVVDFLSQLTHAHAARHSTTSIFSWACTALLCLLLVNALVISRIRNKNDDIKEITMNATTYRIEGMSCNHCRATAEKALLSVSGVETASVSLETKLAHVTGNASREALAKAIEEVGFSLSEA